MHNHNTIDYERLQAAMAELTAENPDLAPEIQRGGQLVTEANVMQTGCNAWQVYDPAMQQVCTVLFALDWSCSCQMHDGPETWRWWLGGWQPVCQHIAAAGLHWLASKSVNANPMHDEASPMHGESASGPGDAYEQVNAVIQGHIESGDTEFIGGLLWAAGWLAAEKKRGMQL